MPTTHVPRPRHRRAIARAAALALLPVLALVTGLTTASATEESPATACSQAALPVTLPDGAGVTLAGTLCQPAGATTVAVLVPGITYNRTYWDFPYQPEKYSVSRAANRAGYATFAIDKIGTGASTRPASTQITLQANVDSVHQVVQALRSGALGHRYPRVDLIGHSYGSVISYDEAGKYRDVDALVTTGISHHIQLINTATQVFLASTPAMLDPAFAGKITDPGYFTTAPGRRSVFYNPATADPAVIGVDEQTKDTFTAADILTYFADDLATTSRGYNGPVLVVNGGADQVICGVPPIGGDCRDGDTLAADERGFYGPAAQVEGIVVPGTGHDLALSTTSTATTAQILTWLGHHSPA